MSLTLPQPELWYRRNQVVADAIGAARTDVVKTYSSLQQAVFEIGFATSTFYSHKKAIGVLGGLTPAGASIWPLLSKEGFAVQRCSHRSDWEALEAWLQALKPETSLVIMSEDHPVTGEVFTEMNDRVTAFLAAKKLFSIRISHFSWPSTLGPFLGPAPAQKLGGWTSFICEVSPDKAFALLGARVKVPNLMVPLEPTGPSSFAVWERELREKLSGTEILHPAPNEWPQGFQPWKSTVGGAESERIVLISNPQLHGESLWNGLGQPPGLLPLSGCHLLDVDWSWWEGAPEPADFRGMLRWDRRFPFPPLEKFNEQVGRQAAFRI